MAEIVLLANFMVSSFIAFIMFKAGRMAMSDPVFWYSVFHFFVFVFRPCFVVLYEYDFVYSYIGYYPDFYDHMFTIFVALVGYLSFCFGAGAASAGLKSVRSLSRGQVCDDVLNEKIVYYTMLLLMPMALFSVYKTIQGASFDGSSSVVMERVKGMAINVNGNGYINEFRNVLPTIILMFYVATKRSLAAVFLLVGFLLYRMYVGHGRFNIVMLFFGLFLIEYYVFGKRLINVRYVAVGIGVALIFSVLGENRELIKSIFVDVEIVSHPVIEKRFLEGMDFANFEYLTYILGVVPDLSGTYHYGVQYLQLFTEPVPRVLWSEKPVGPPIEFYNLMDFGNWLGLTQSTIGDAWQNGGVFGVVATMFLWGGILTHVFQKTISGSDYAKLIWIVIVPYFLQMFRDGGVVTIFKFMLFSTLPFVVYYLLKYFLMRGGYEAR